MRNDSDFHPHAAPSGSERPGAVQFRKPWETPRVILGTGMDDAEAGGGSVSDNTAVPS